MKNSTLKLEYREYKLSEEFPFLLLTPQSVHTSYQDSAQQQQQQQQLYHFHNCLEIGICHKGEHTLSFENTTYTLNNDNFFILSPYSMHFFTHKEASQGEDCKYLYIKPDELLYDFFPYGLPNEMQWYKTSEVPFIFSASEHSDLFYYLNLMIEESIAKKDNYKLIIKGLFLTFMTILTRQIGVTDNHSPSRYKNMSSLIPALRHIHSAPEKATNSKALSELCNMTSAGFNSLFSELIGETPHQYITRLRLQKACELLYSTELSIINISIEVGFQSLSGFYKAFKTQYDISPKEWRNKKRSIQKKNLHHSSFSAN
ncbi:MAG: helix-turn-helix transcriptional regulator [Lachnospiraceae bacterium]|nr:helix-turn-helix transcriptional regulator [Lachnospiraceae bacterium]